MLYNDWSVPGHVTPVNKLKKEIISSHFSCTLVPNNNSLIGIIRAYGTLYFVSLHLRALAPVFDIFSCTEYAGLVIAVILCIASPFSRQIAIGNAGPTSTLESIGPKRNFRCNFLNIALIY